ncbi:hypothetical protein [Gordonia terrae]|uniref:hypothetical protein n=1 Tax=Gordonia terrae TaxID=2055 RepID=UPI003F6C1FC2
MVAERFSMGNRRIEVIRTAGQPISGPLSAYIRKAFTTIHLRDCYRIITLAYDGAKPRRSLSGQPFDQRRKMTSLENVELLTAIVDLLNSLRDFSPIEPPTT